MSDKELVLEVLHQTAEAVGKVLRRFAPVNSVAYLTARKFGIAFAVFVAFVEGQEKSGFTT